LDALFTLDALDSLRTLLTLLALVALIALFPFFALRTLCGNARVGLPDPPVSVFADVGHIGTLARREASAAKQQQQKDS
jgi:hypothetical protein